MSRSFCYHEQFIRVFEHRLYSSFLTSIQHLVCSYFFNSKIQSHWYQKKSFFICPNPKMSKLKPPVPCPDTQTQLRHKTVPIVPQVPKHPKFQQHTYPDRQTIQNIYKLISTAVLNYYVIAKKYRTTLCTLSN